MGESVDAVVVIYAPRVVYNEPVRDMIFTPQHHDRKIRFLFVWASNHCLTIVIRPKNHHRQIGVGAMSRQTITDRSNHLRGRRCWVGGWVDGG